VPKIEELNLLKIKDVAPSGAHAAQARVLRERNYNFSSFVVSTFYRFKTLPSGVNPPEAD